MILGSPWGNIIEQQEWKPGLSSVVTALHSGFCLSYSNFKELSAFAQSLGVKFQDSYFFGESGPAAIVALELGIEYAPIKNLLLKVNDEFPHYFLDESGAKWLQKLSTITESSPISEDKLITQIIPLDCGYKVLTADEKEYLLSSYPNNKNLEEQEILGEVTNFYKKEYQEVQSENLPQSLIEKFNLRPEEKITLRASNVTYAYILEVSSLGDNNYLGEVDVCHFPQMLKVWNE